MARLPMLVGPAPETATAPRHRADAPAASLRSPLRSSSRAATSPDRRPRITVAPALVSVLKNQADAIDGSERSRACPSGVPTVPPPRLPDAASLRSRDARPAPDPPSSDRQTAPPDHRRTGTPVRGQGVRETSPPRMLNSHAIDAGEVITAASTFCSASILPSRARFADEVSPECSSACGTTACIGAEGRSVHAMSIGLGLGRHQRDTCLRRRISQPIQRIRRHQPRIMRHFLSVEFLLRQPPERARIDQVADREQACRQLLLHLRACSARPRTRSPCRETRTPRQPIP